MNKAILQQEIYRSEFEGVSETQQERKLFLIKNTGKLNKTTAKLVCRWDLHEQCWMHVGVR